MKNSEDKKSTAGASITDLSKAFDCLNYELLIAKQNSSGFNYNALKLISNSLHNRTGNNGPKLMKLLVNGDKSTLVYHRDQY